MQKTYLMNMNNVASPKNRLTITMDAWYKYKDVRCLFLESLKRNWADLPYPFVIACDENIIDEQIPKQTEVIVCDKLLTDSKRHLEALKNSHTEYVLLIVEDGLITDTVDEKRIEDILDYMDANNIDFCKMVPVPNRFGKRIKDFKNAKFINKKQAYGVNYLCGIYRKSFLFSLLDSECKDSWEIEEMLLKQAALSKRGYFSDKIIVTDNPLHIVFCVESGKWSHWAIKYAKKNGYAVESDRGIWSAWHDIIAKTKHFISTIVPIKFRFALKKFFSKLGFKFATKQ